jgi:SNF2 family DNA or RNA helicase
MVAPPLLEHQVEGIEWLRSHPRALLADEAGLGKSAQLLLSTAKEPVLIVAPAMVLESGTWDNEIALWAPGIDATQVSYTSIAQRGARGKVERDYNGFPMTPLKPEYRRKWGSVKLDEAHHIKGRKTSWVYAISKLEADEIQLATGTPIPNWAQEAFMLLRMLWPEKARAGHDLGSYWRWAKEWFEVETDFFGAMQVGDLLNDTDEGWAKFRRDNWGDRMIRRFREECLDLPPLTHQDWRVKMGTDQARIYRELKKDFITWLDSGEEVSIWSEPGLLVKLAQVATGTRVIDPTAKIDGKLRVLQTILADRRQPTLVVAYFRDSVDQCARVAEEIGMRVGVVRGGLASTSRRAAIQGFQHGELDVLVASVETISEGMTLHQGGADQIVKVERSWRPVQNEQVDRRLHRIGVVKPVHAIDLITLNTVDVRQMRLLGEKTEQQIKALGREEIRALV